MEEIVPVQALPVVSVRHLLEVVENHKERGINADAGEGFQLGVVCGLNGLVPGVRRKQGIQPGKLAGIKAKAVHPHNAAHQLHLVDVERQGQGLHVNHVGERRTHNEYLIVLVGESVHTGNVVIRLQESKIVAHGFQSGNNGVGVGGGCRLDSDRVKLPFQRRLGQHILHDKELVIVLGSIQGLGDTAHKVADTLEAQKRLSELLLGNGGLVEFLVVHGMESAANIGQFALEYLVLGSFGVKLLGRNDIHKQFFDALAVFHHALFEHGPGVAIELGVDNHQADTVHQGAQESVSVGLESADCLTSRSQGLQSLGFSCLAAVRQGLALVQHPGDIGKAGFGSHAVHNVRRSCVHLCFLRDSCHWLYLLK